MSDLRERLIALKREHRDAMRCLSILSEAVAFYADPGTYHATTLINDPPSGDIVRDFSRDHGDPYYNRPMLGKTARKAIKRHNAIIAKYAATLGDGSGPSS